MITPFMISHKDACYQKKISCKISVLNEKRCKIKKNIIDKSIMYIGYNER
jgi:hypothetical protein